MEISDYLFYVFAAITVGSGAVVVFTRRLVHAAFALLFTFLGVAGLYVFLGADFLAGAQVLIYVGGTLMLLLFGVMLTTRIYDLEAMARRVQFAPGLLIVGAGFLLLLAVIFRTTWRMTKVGPAEPTTAWIGTLLMTDYVLPFEVASILLLAALIGAVFLASKDDEEGGRE